MERAPTPGKQADVGGVFFSLEKFRCRVKEGILIRVCGCCLLILEKEVAARKNIN